jgi:hypothetical protein
MSNLKELRKREYPRSRDGEVDLGRQRKLAVAPKRGNLIVSNFTSPFDVIYFAAKYVPYRSFR